MTAIPDNDGWIELAERVLQTRKSNNNLDVLVEIALFKPDPVYKAVRANAAGTKLIYTRRDDTERTHRARDWTHGTDRCLQTAAALRARAVKP